MYKVITVQQWYNAYTFVYGSFKSIVYGNVLCSKTILLHSNGLMTEWSSMPVQHWNLSNRGGFWWCCCWLQSCVQPPWIYECSSRPSYPLQSPRAYVNSCRLLQWLHSATSFSSISSFSFSPLGSSSLVIRWP